MSPLLNRSHSASVHAPACIPARYTGRQSLVLDPDELNLAPVRRSIKCVLLSDDHQFCILVRSYLQHMGFCVFTCSSSNRAEQQFLDRRDIDLWVVDVEALGFDAMYLAARVRDLHAELPIVVISGAGQEDGPAISFPGPECIRIKKPIQLPDLLAIIQRALAAPSPASPFAPSRDGEPLDNDWMSALRRNHMMN